MALVNEGFLHYTDMKKFLKIFFSETTCQILKKFQRNQGLTLADIPIAQFGP